MLKDVLLLCSFLNPSVLLLGSVFVYFSEWALAAPAKDIGRDQIQIPSDPGAADELPREDLIPTSPSAPPDLRQKIPTEYPHCERYFVFQDKKSECDSNTEKDAARLRSVMRDVPSAIAELDLYQENRQKVHLAAYVGTAGILAILIGMLAINPSFDPGTGSPRFGGYVMIGGIALAAHSFIYSLSMNKANEAHVGNAVSLYNAARPDQPIGLQFKTDIEF